MSNVLTFYIVLRMLWSIRTQALAQQQRGFGGLRVPRVSYETAASIIAHVSLVAHLPTLAEKPVLNT